MQGLSKILIIVRQGRSLFNYSCKKYLHSIKHTGDYDVTIVGGGIIGAVTARQLITKYPHLRLLLLEKENQLGCHQTGHNSGVVHAGIYYKTGSLKAKLCVEGMKRTFEYCDRKKIPYKKIGKLIVATNDTEVDQLAVLYDRGLKNKVPDMELLENERAIRKKEPECKGLKAIWSPHTAIVNFAEITRSHGKEFVEEGGTIYLDFEVKNIKESPDCLYPIEVQSKLGKTIRTKYVLTCGGLYSDKLSVMTGCPENPKIVPFRGEYLVLTPDKRNLVRSNIYPVPDPRLPFLGVHFTPRIDGAVWLGPNAVLAFGREGYSYMDVNFTELYDTLSHAGFRKLARTYLTYGIKEMTKSLFYSLQVKSLQKFIPNITVKDVQRGPSGVRAQALNADGTLLEDFYFDSSKEGTLAGRVLHCRNIPSPGATSSMAIARMLVEKVTEQFKLP